MFLQAELGVGKLYFAGARTNPNVPVGEGTTVFVVPIKTRQRLKVVGRLPG